MNWVRAAAQGEPAETAVVWLAAGEYPTQRRAAREEGPGRLASCGAAAGIPRPLGGHCALQKETAYRGGSRWRPGLNRSAEA
ncbi:hypothetical protein NDU88_005160 [Pleurodeles waltl]|uniref:Uncharacterized protein n=1 Tax=Pleurodeles waltl TaxID=8319 RepID=A0AAV7LKE1_PLEWA|nr:hypothetical protein NDU88_005160 [Pleurodeles waltl]